MIHFGVGVQALAQLIRNSILRYRAYAPVLREMGREGDGALTLSVYAVRGVPIDALLRGPGVRRKRYGIAKTARIRSAGFQLWPTSPATDGRAVPFSEDHFDIPLLGGKVDIDRRIPKYLTLNRREQRDLRARLSEPFIELLALFEPRFSNSHADKSNS